MSDVKPGQIWEDEESAGRYLRVVMLRDEEPTLPGNAPIPARAVVERVAFNETTGHAGPLPGFRKTVIRLDRFRPNSTGYRLVQDVED